MYGLSPVVGRIYDAYGTKVTFSTYSTFHENADNQVIVAFPHWDCYYDLLHNDAVLVPEGSDIPVFLISGCSLWFRYLADVSILLAYTLGVT